RRHRRVHEAAAGASAVAAAPAAAVRDGELGPARDVAVVGAVDARDLVAGAVHQEHALIRRRRIDPALHHRRVERDGLDLVAAAGEAGDAEALARDLVAAGRGPAGAVV